MARRVPTWAKWLIGAAVAVLVLVTVGPFVYIHFIEGSPKPKLSLDSITTTTAVPGAATSAAANASGGATTASASIDGTWHIADGSQVGYRVKEVLFGQSTTAVGRTSSVTGQATINGPQVTAADFSVDMSTVSSDQRQRDNQFRNRIMDVSSFPTATFKLTSPIDLGSAPPDGTRVTTKAHGDLTLRGQTKPVTIDLTAQRANGQIQVAGSTELTFSDWGIPNPSFGPAETEDHGTLEVLLVFSR